MKLAVIIPFYKRTDITKLCFKHLATQQKKFKFKVFVAGDDKSIVPKSFTFVDVENNPLGNKLNVLLQQTKDFDAVTVLGSDNFISDSVFKLFNTLDLKEKVYYGFDNLHVYSVWHDKLTSDFPYTENGNTIGVARLWTKATLEAMNYTLWSAERNNGLDSDSKKRMLSKGVKEISLSYGDNFLLDVKQDYNITSPELVNTGKENYDVNYVVAKLGVIGNDILALQKGEIKQIKRLSKKIDMKKVRCKVLIAFNKYVEGQEVELKGTNFNELRKLGYVQIITEQEKPKVKRTTKR